MSTTAPFENSVKDSFIQLQEWIKTCNAAKSAINLEDENMLACLHNLGIGKRDIKHALPIVYPDMDSTTLNNLIFIQLISAILKHQVDLDFLNEFFYHHEKNPNNTPFSDKAIPKAYKEVWSENHYLHYYHMTTLLLKAYKNSRESLMRTKAELYATCKRIQQNIEQLRINHLKVTHEVRHLIQEKNEALSKKARYQSELKLMQEQLNALPIEKASSKNKKKEGLEREVNIHSEHIKKLNTIIDNIRKEGNLKLKDLKNTEQKEIEDLNLLKHQKQKLDIIDKDVEKNNYAMKELGLDLNNHDNAYSFDTTSILNLFKENKNAPIATSLEADLISDITIDLENNPKNP